MPCALRRAAKALLRKHEPLSVMTRSMRMPSCWSYARAASRNATALTPRSLGTISLNARRL